MTSYEPASGYNLPPGCFERDIDGHFGGTGPTCGDCSHLLEGCITALTAERRLTMTISDEDRREIANELRKQAAYCDGSLSEWWQRLQDTVTGEVDFADPKATFRAIADLIDRPTCSMEYRPELSGNEIYPTEVYRCSRCG